MNEFLVGNSAFIKDIQAVRRIYSEICQAFPPIQKTLSEYLAQLIAMKEYPARAEGLLSWVQKTGELLCLSYEDIVDGFIEFCLTYLREQDYFMKTGELSGASKGFDRIRQEVYEDHEYMTQYMLGNLASIALFPHHYKEYSFFLDQFLPMTSDSARCAEFGLGHGLWLSCLLADAPHRRGIGYDVSDASLRIARALLAIRSIPEERYRLVHADVATEDLGNEYFDAMIASGLFEHIEAPSRFAKKIYQLLRPQTGRLFTMVPTNTAHPDHLVLFRHVDEIRNLFAGVGFKVVAEIVASTKNHSLKSTADSREPEVYVGIFKRD